MLSLLGIIAAVLIAYAIVLVLVSIVRRCSSCRHEHEFFREDSRIERKDGATVLIGRHECVYCGHFDPNVIVTRHLEKPADTPAGSPNDPPATIPFTASQNPTDRIA